MAVGIITDSVTDLSPQIVAGLGISVVPLSVRFGDEVYRDGIDLTPDQFYAKLKTSKVFPNTSVPAPADFVRAYDELSEKTDEILVILVSARLSATYEVARQSIAMMKRKCRVELLDSETATMAEGFIVMAAAKAAKGGAGLDEVIEVARQAMPRVDFRAAFDTLEYLRRGGRIGRAQAFLGSMLSINPIIALKNGLVEPAGRTRSRAKAIDHLYEFAAGYANIEEMAVENTACPEEAEALRERLGAIFPEERIHRSRMTPVIGTHTGPGLLLVAVMGDKEQP
ncbi:MAG TPA: DegV family protein [Dehalococcoidales bacterium]|nr:DegV family protein [Dehalococcoidales bacterium]